MSQLTNDGWQRATMNRGAVAAGNADAVDAAIEILEDGGNAIDAAVTAAFAMGTVEPLDSGVGAAGFMTLHAAATGTTTCVDFMGVAPTRARYELYSSVSPQEGYQIHVRGRENQLGHRAVAVPGAARGLAMANEAHGRLPLGRLLEPSIRLAREGYTVAPKAALRMSRTSAMLDQTAECRRVLKKPDGSVYEAGDRMSNPDYAATLECIAEEGAEAVYTGSIAQAILADMKAHDGFLSSDDLANYRALWRQPASGKWRDLDVATMSPPSAGALVFAGLAALDSSNVPADERRYEALARAMLGMFEKRAAVMGDPGFVPVDLSSLGLKSGESTETTSLAAMDADGNAACITYSNNNHSGVVVPGTGILLNNSMQLFNPWPNNPNEVLGGKRPVSSMMPTILFRDGRPVMTIGASGATRIPSAVMQVMFNTLALGMGLEDAVRVPRVHAEMETLLSDEDLGDTATALGEKLGLRHVVMAGRDPSMGVVQSISVGDDGSATAVGDPRAGAQGRVV